MKKRNSKSKKITTVVANVEDDGDYNIAMESKEPERFDCATHPTNLYLEQFYNLAKIVVVIAEVLQYTVNDKPKTYRMEDGRQMAQACHAVSALKLSYIEEAVRFGCGDPLKLVIQLMEIPITTITVKARDTKELLHINELAQARGVLHFLFSDDNAQVYGTNDRIPTALAIGPLMTTQFVGLTDYLPLWTSNL